MHSRIAENRELILKQIAEACESVGRDPSEVRLVAVSKTVGLTELSEAREAGIHDFGENRAKMFKEKYEAFPDEHWHFIGSVQTNKVKDYVGKAALIHSVASEHALTAISRRAQLLGIIQSLLIEVNLSGEESKDGTTPDGLNSLLDLAAGLEGIEVKGLMTMAPQAQAETVRAVFRGLRELRDSLFASYGALGRVQLRELSMGMSDDFPLAVQEGATILRIGRSIWL